MTEFPHPDLIPDKFRHVLKPYGNGHVLRIDSDQHGVDLYVSPEELKLARKEWFERMINPAVAALEAHIAHG